jgi:mannosylglycerate hydrolase
MSESPEQVWIVSHTHWDREWYQSAHEFRVDLERVVAGVLAALEPGGEDEFRHFLLDGQAIALADYLALRPDEAGRLEALVRAGRLAIGPWYVLPDELLVSGEALVRNLLIGHSLCAPLGGAQSVGYLPDSFGHVAQLPQILRGAGIDSFIYTRGNGDEAAACGLEFDWLAPDGSRVLAVNQCGGYCNAGGLGHEEIWHAHTRREVLPARAVDQVAAVFVKMAPVARSPVWLLNNGCDHFPVQRDFGRVLAALRAAWPQVDFRHGSLPEYLAALRAAGGPRAEYRGELLGGRDHLILSGVWSARLPLKQANDECQHLLARVAEPVSAAAHFLHGVDYPTGPLREAWRLLLANHPHDSICGCSTDAVHREMLPRFAGVRETATRLLARCLDDLAPRFAPRAAEDRDTVITLFNPLPVPRREIVERLVILQPFGYDLDRLALVDAAGRPVACEFIAHDFVERFWGVDYRALLTAPEQLARFAGYRESFGPRILRPAAEAGSADCFLHLRFEAELPALGHASFRLVETGAAAPPYSGPPVRCEGTTLDNGLVRVTLHADGSLDLVDHRDGRRYHGLNQLVDEEDAGDEYDYSHSPRPDCRRAAGLPGDVVCLDAGPGRASLEARFAWPLPAGLDAQRRGRRAELHSCAVAVRVTLTAGSHLVDIDTCFDNRVEDHRLRAEFPTPLATDRVVSEGHFLVHERALLPPAGEDWAQPHPGSYPQQDYSLLADARGGLALLNRGLPELHPLAGPAGAALSLTLLRAVGWLSRDDFASRRRTNAGPTLPTPEAQCAGLQVCHYALLPFAGSQLDADIKGASEVWRTPPLASQGVAAGLVPGGASLVQKENPRVAVSAIKRHEARDTLMIRLWNLGGEPARERLRLGRPLAAAWQVNLLEERGEAVPIDDPHQIEIELGPHAILSVELEFAPRP